MTQITPEVAAAIVTAVASLLVALATYWSTRTNERDIEKLKDDLAERKAERDALRDYEYEARKRLYRQCGPLIFLLFEQADAVLHRIHNLARAASRGNLDGTQSWLARDYYRLSTFYRFIAPLATVKLIQARLTLVDLSLDAYLHYQYAVAKQVVASFGDDFDLAKLSSPPLRYDPHAGQAASLRSHEPAVYWQQGIPAGILDNAAECLLTQARNRVITFVEFEREFKRVDSHLRGAFDRIAYLFDNFHPKTRPILWRLLLAQVLLYRALIRLPRRYGTADDLGLSLLRFVEFSDSERESLRWQEIAPADQEHSPSEQHFVAAERYVGEAFKRIVQDLQLRIHAP